MKLDRSELKKLIVETLNEAERGNLRSIEGGGEGSGIPIGELSDVKNTLEEINDFMDHFQKLKKQIEQIYERELAKKNRPLISPEPEKINIPD